MKEFGIWHEMDTAPKDGSHFVVRKFYITDVYDDDVHGGEIPVERGVCKGPPKYVSGFNRGIPGAVSS